MDGEEPCDELDSRLELGRALHHRSTLRHELGQVDLARADIAPALTLFEECGVQPEVEKALSLLQALT